MAHRMPIGTPHYDDWVRRLEAKGWNKLSKEEMQWYRSLTAQRDEIARLERALRDAEAERAVERALPECDIRNCTCKVVKGHLYCKKHKENLESWGTKTRPSRMLLGGRTRGSTYFKGSEKDGPLLSTS